MKRAAPAVATANKRRALNNIERKIFILKEWISTGIPLCGDTSDLDFYPKSVRQFNLWDASQNTSKLDVEIERNANDTLKKHEGVFAEVVQLVQIIQLRAAEQIQGKKKPRIGKLQAELALEVRLRKVAEAELIKLRRELKAEQLSHRNALRRAENRMAEFKSELERLTAINARLAEENSVLVASAIKVRPIRGVDK